MKRNVSMYSFQSERKIVLKYLFSIYKIHKSHPLYHPTESRSLLLFCCFGSRKFLCNRVEVILYVQFYIRLLKIYIKYKNF